MARLGDLATIVRSKNAGPFTITIDLIFTDLNCAEKVSKALSPSIIAKLYRVKEEEVEIILYPPAKAVKINIPRLIPSGHPGDTDVYGDQQHAPLLNLELNLECV